MSTIHKFSGKDNIFQWVDVNQEIPQAEGLSLITKQILIGSKEGAPHFSMRYFKVEPNGHTKLEQHSHEHGIIVLNGKGMVQIGENKYDLEPYDALIVSGNDLHQFSNPYHEPFGFICVIPFVE